MRTPGADTGLIGQEAALDAAVRVDAPVAEERPVAAHFLHACEVHLGDDEGLLVGGRLRDDDAKRISQEGVTPELDAGALPVELFEAHAIHRRDPAAVRDGVAPLDRAPGIDLRRAVLGLLARVPADRRGIAQQVRALQRGEPGGLRIPLVPAHERPDRSHAGVEGAEAQIARREIELLVIGRVVGDVHLAVDPLQRAVGLDDRRRVVVQPRRATLEQRRDHHDARRARDLAERLGTGAGDWLGQIEERVIFALADVQRAEQLGETNQRCALRGGGLHLGEVRRRLGGHAHLYEGDLERRHAVKNRPPGPSVLRQRAHHAGGGQGSLRHAAPPIPAALMAARWTWVALTAVNAALSASPVRMRITRSIGCTKILPSPTSPVRADERMACTHGSTNGSEQTISIFTFSWNSMTSAVPRYCSTSSCSPPCPLTRLSVMPVIPARNSAALTSGRRSGRTMVVMSFMLGSQLVPCGPQVRPPPPRERAPAEERGATPS